MTPKKLMTFGIMSALVAWGVYLAVGATGMFVQEDMMDARKSGIVIACVALFLGLWAIVLFGTKYRSNVAVDSQVAGDSQVIGSRPWSRPGLATLGFAIVGYALWAGAAGVWQTATSPGVSEDARAMILNTTTVLGWLAAFCVLAAASSGMIALSSKQVKRGKWFGILGLVGFVAAFVVFVARMTP